MTICIYTTQDEINFANSLPRALYKKYLEALKKRKKWEHEDEKIVTIDGAETPIIARTRIDRVELSKHLQYISKAKKWTSLSRI